MTTEAFKLQTYPAKFSDPPRYTIVFEVYGASVHAGLTSNMTLYATAVLPFVPRIGDSLKVANEPVCRTVDLVHWSADKGFKVYLGKAALDTIQDMLAAGWTKEAP